MYILEKDIIVCVFIYSEVMLLLHCSFLSLLFLKIYLINIYKANRDLVLHS